MDFQSAMETFAEAWVAANAGQQTQALALTRGTGALAAAMKSPSVTLADIAVKKEHPLSLSPPNPHASSNAQQSSCAAASVASSVASSMASSVAAAVAAAAAASAASAADEAGATAHRRASLQGVTHEKLVQLQAQQQQHSLALSQQQAQQQQAQQQQLLLHQHQQQQQLQQQQSASAASGQDEGRSPRYSTAGSGSGGGRQSSEASPVPAEERNLSSTASSQNPSLAATPKLGDRDAGGGGGGGVGGGPTVGSISCLPPSALTGVGVAGQQQQQPSSQAERVLPSPLDTRRDFDVSKVNAKSLPLHCVVESVHSLQASLTIDTRNPWKRRPNIETDSYVIVAAATPWSEIVQTALQRLGYSQETASTGRGSLIIKNWKPIPLEQISDNPLVPVCDIIGELTSVVTLRIVILRAKPSPFGEIKDKLLKLLVLQSHAVLRSTGCPLDEVTLSQICRSSYQNTFAIPGGEIPDDVRRKFDQWWSNQLSPQSSMTPKMLPFMTAPPAVPGDMDFPVGTAAVAAAAAAAAAAQAGLHAATAGAGSVIGGSSIPGIGVAPGISASRESLLLNDGVGGSHHGAAVPGTTAPHPNMMVHPAMHASMHHTHHHHGHHTPYPNQKTRMRTSFDPEMELPKLQKWFSENPHPSRQQIQTYVVQLNSLESRRGRKPLDVNNVVYWFKNARAAQKRAEMRGGLGAVGALGHAAMNGYLGQHGQQLGQGLGGGGGGVSGGLGGGSVSGSLGGGRQMGGGSGVGGAGGMLIPHDYLKSPLSLKSEDIDTMSQHSEDMDMEDQSRPCSPQLPLSLTTHERHRSPPAGANDDGDDEERSQSRRGSSLKDDESEAQDLLLNGSLCRAERSRAGSYNEEDGGGAVGVSGGATGDDEDERGEQEPGNNNNNNNSGSGSNNNVNSENSSEQPSGAGQNGGEATNNNSNNNNSTSSNNNGGSSHPSGDQQEQREQQIQSTESPKRTTPKQEEDEDLDMDEDDDDNENDTSQMDDYRSPSPSDMAAAAAVAARKDLHFPMVPNSMFSQSFMYMSHYMPGFGQAAAAAGHPHAHHAAAAAAAAAAGMQQNPLMGSGSLNLSNLSNEERRKRNRTFIDPVTEVPKLEQWFAMNTHPSHNLILKYTEDLNTMPYRQKFPRLESKNVQFWFKNRRAKCKRLKMSLYDSSQCSQMSALNSFVHKYEERD